MKKFLSVVGLFIISLTMQAAVIYSQPGSVGSAGFLSARFGVDGSGFDEFVWDSFSVTTNVTVREIQWRGTRTGSVPADFQISINTIALPGGTIWNTGGSASETPTGTPGVYDYRFTLPAGFVLTGGQTYWLQVFATQNEIPNWQWSAGTGGNNSHYAQVPAVTGNYRFILTGGDVAFSLLNAATVPVNITVAKSPSNGGTTTGGGTFSPGANVTVTANAASGRTFLNWTEAGVVVSTSTNFTFAADGNKTLTANFSGPNTGPYVINAIPNPGVNGNVGGAGTFNADEIVDLDVTPADGVSFVGWTENGELVNLPYAGGVFQVTATADRNLIANFSYPGYTYYINGVVAPSLSGSIVISNTAGLSGNSYNGGTLITLTAKPNSGYRFVSWKQGAGLGDLSGTPHIVSTNPVLKHMVCYGTTLTANFELSAFNLTLGASPVASGTVSGAGTYGNGASVTVNASPAVGYAFANWKLGANIVSTSPSYTFSPTNHTALTANFYATNHTVTAAASPMASGSITGAGVVGNGASVTLTAIPAPGYVFTNWTLNGAPAGTNNPITFDALADYDFVANFTAASGPVAPSQLAVTNVFFNASQTATVISSNINAVTLRSGDYLFTHSVDGYWSAYAGGPPTGRFFSVFWPNGIHAQAITAGPSVGAGANITIKRVDGKRFDLQAFTGKLLANTAGAGGAFEVMPLLNGEDAFNDPLMFDCTGYGGQSFSHTPMLSGYDTYKIHLWVDWAITALTLIDTNSAAPPGNATITAIVSPPGAGTVNGGGTYTNGASVTVTAAANNGFVFLDWTESGSQVSATTNFSFTATGNRTLVANFIANEPPLAFGGAFFQLAGQPLAINISDLMWNDYDPDGDPVSFVGVSVTSSNGLTLTTNDTQILIPANAVADGFSYTISDGIGATVTSTATISIITNVTSQALALDMNSTPGSATVNFSGVPWYYFEAQRATNAAFTGTLQIWPVQAGPDGSIFVWDDFADLGSPPSQAFYRLSHAP